MCRTTTAAGGPAQPQRPPRPPLQLLQLHMPLLRWQRGLLSSGMPRNTPGGGWGGGGNYGVLCIKRSEEIHTQQGLICKGWFGPILGDRRGTRDIHSACIASLPPLRRYHSPSIPASFIQTHFAGSSFPLEIRLVVELNGEMQGQVGARIVMEICMELNGG